MAKNNQNWKGNFIAVSATHYIGSEEPLGCGERWNPENAVSFLCFPEGSHCLGLQMRPREDKEVLAAAGRAESKTEWPL